MVKTTSLEMSKQMKELGFPQKSYFSWGIDEKDEVDTYLTEGSPWGEGIGKIAAASTAEEVLEQLPAYIERGNEVSNLEMYPVCLLDGRKFNGEYNAGYWKHGQNGGAKSYANKQTNSLTEALGELWVDLKEQGLLKGKV